MDEPETDGAIGLAGRDGLDNLIVGGPTPTCSDIELARCAATARSSRAGVHLPRRRLERDQGDLGSRWDPLLAADVDGASSA